MQASDLAKQVRQFYQQLYMIAKRYGHLNQIIGKYFHIPRRGQTTGLPLNFRQTTESHLTTYRNVLKNQARPATPNTDSGSGELSSIDPVAQGLPVLPLVLPTILRKNSTWKAATLLPSSVRFDSNQGRFIPFMSQIRSLRESNAKNRWPTGTGQMGQASPFGSNPANATSDSGQESPRQPAVPVKVPSVARRLLQAAASLPLIPLALARVSAGSVPMQSPSPSSVPVNLSISNGGQTAPLANVPVQSVSRTPLAGSFGLPRRAATAVSVMGAVLQRQVNSIPLLGLNRTVMARVFPDLARANRISESKLPLPQVPIGGVHTPTSSAGTHQNLSQIVMAYAETESSQARLQLTNRSIPRSAPLPKLPTNQPLSLKNSSYSSANLLGMVSAELPTIASSEARSMSPIAVPAETLPRLSDLEAQNFELEEKDDMIAMEELRTRISKILAEELRRHLPGE